MSVIYKADYVLPMDGSDPHTPGEVWVESGKIIRVGQGISATNPQAQVKNLGKSAILPGFVNAHSHIDYTLSRNLHDALNLWQWLHRVGFRKVQTPDYELIAASARLGAAECARSGITCLADCSFSGAAAYAIDEIGLRGIIYKELFGQSMGADYKRQFALVLEEVRRLQEAVSGRISIGISPHSIYTSTKEVLNLCAQTCADIGIPLSIHLAETGAETQFALHGTGPIADWRRSLGYEVNPSGCTPVQILEDAGLLREKVLLAHCVHVTDAEVKKISSSGAGVAHCPRSNAYLGAGIFPFSSFRREDARTGIGTDSSATCLRIDFFEEMRFAAAIHRAKAQDAQAVSAKEILEMATKGGAAAIGMGDVTGQLKRGLRADIIALDLGSMLPGEDIYMSILSRSPADVILCLVDGLAVDEDIDARTQELAYLMEQHTIA